MEVFPNGRTRELERYLLLEQPNSCLLLDQDLYVAVSESSISIRPARRGARYECVPIQSSAHIRKLIDGVKYTFKKYSVHMSVEPFMIKKVQPRDLDEDEEALNDEEINAIFDQIKKDKAQRLERVGNGNRNGGTIVLKNQTQRSSIGSGNSCVNSVVEELNQVVHDAILENVKNGSYLSESESEHEDKTSMSSGKSVASDIKENGTMEEPEETIETPEDIASAFFDKHGVKGVWRNSRFEV